MKYVEGYTAGENTASQKNISTSDLIYFCSNWVWRAVEALTQAKDFNSNPSWIADRLNISVDAAKDALEGLERIGLIVKTESGLITNAELFYQKCNALERSDLFEIHNKIKLQIDSKVTSRACFSNTVVLSKKQYVTEFYQKFSELVKDLNNKSLNDSECTEVFAFELSLARLTREKA